MKKIIVIAIILVAGCNSGVEPTPQHGQDPEIVYVSPPDPTGCLRQGIALSGSVQWYLESGDATAAEQAMDVRSESFDQCVEAFMEEWNDFLAARAADLQ